jgi:hypothetical protein
MQETHECLTCGRPFPRGQGVTLSVSGKNLEFHSKSCAYSFMRELLYSLKEDCLTLPLREVLAKYEEKLEQSKKKAEKKI